MDSSKFGSIVSYLCTLFVICFRSPSSGLSNPETNSGDRCLVNSPSGSYRGLHRASVLSPDCHFCAYTDIPFAVAPRFGKPTLRKLGPYTLNATQDNIACAQPRQGQNMSVDGVEDCLFLNVFTPQSFVEKGQPLKAVIVFIYGGAYLFGAKTGLLYSSDFFMPQDIVLVTINHRVGAFGFLNLGIPECSGNMGIRDQIEALKWVRQNIESFGGDRNKVTVMGESSGARSAYLLPLTPLSRGLITNGIICQSAVYTDRINYDIMLKKTTEYYSIEFAKFMGYRGDPNNRYAMLNFFRGLSTQDLVSGNTRYTDYLVKTSDIVYSDLPFVASVDRHIPGAVFPNSLDELGKAVPDIPIIYGVNDADGDYNTFADPPTIADYILTHLGLYLYGLNPVYTKDKRTLKQAIEFVKEYYNPDGRDNKIDVSVKIETYFDFNNLYTRQLPVFRNSYHKNKIWLYEFRYADGFNDFKKLLLGQYADLVGGASHVQELEYLFFAPLFFPNGLKATEDELSLINRMTKWWANFAKTGNPNSEDDYCPCTDDVIWKPTSPTHDTYLQIGVKNTSRAVFVEGRKIFQSQRDFFDALLEFVLNRLRYASCSRPHFN